MMNDCAMGSCVMRPENAGLVCDERECYHCGWNPKIEEARREKVRESIGEFAVRWVESKKNKKLA